LRPAGEDEKDFPMKELLDWVQEAMTAEEAVKGICDQILAGPPVARDLDGSRLLGTIRNLSDAHIEALRQLFAELKEEPSTVQGAIGAGIGKTLGFVRRTLPSQDLTRALRDAYVALNYTAVGYHVLYTHCVLLKRPATAGLALRHLRAYTPAIRKLSHLLAWAAAHSHTGPQPPPVGALEKIVQTLLEAWGSDIPLRQ
jgi:hypothetical protein